MIPRTNTIRVDPELWEWLGAYAPESGQSLSTGWRSAVIYTMLASCRNRGIEPYGYLKGVLEILPTDNQEVRSAA